MAYPEQHQVCLRSQFVTSISYVCHSVLVKRNRSDLNPIFLPDELDFSVTFFTSSNTILKYLSWVESFSMTAANLRLSSSFVSSICLRRTYARIIAMFTSIACSLFNTLESRATSCSVNAYGRCRRPPRPTFEITNCDLK